MASYIAVSNRTKESIKTALAMTIAYGIALSLDWDRAMWAAIAVAMVSLATIGESLNKAAMRMLGTFFGICIAFIFIALTAQDRWNFIILLATYIAICTYMMSGTKHNYFWHVSGFVCAIICFDAGPNSENAFSIAMLRAQETGLGILVYSIIAFLIWPNSSRTQFYSIAQKLASTQKQLTQQYLELFNCSGNSTPVDTIRFQEIQIRTQFNALLDASVSESNEISEMKHVWRKYQNKSIELIETMEQIRCDYPTLKGLAVIELFPNLKEFTNEIITRLLMIENLLSDKNYDYCPAKLSLKIDKNALDNLLNFQKSALALTHTHFRELERITRELFDLVHDIKHNKHSDIHASTTSTPKRLPALDLDRLGYSIRIMLIMFIAFISVIYIDEMPGKYTFVTICTVFGMFISTMPQLSVWLLLKPALMSILFGGLIYLFIMPHLSSYIELGPLIFGVTFLICYLFSTPKQVLGRALGLAMFIVITAIDNQQYYSFIAVANTALIFPLAFIIIAITAYIPKSLLAEHVFQRLLKRYFSSSARLMNTFCETPDRNRPILKSYKNSYYLNEVSKIPLKLNTWIKYLPKNEKNDATSEQVQSLIYSTEVLALRIKELQKVHESTHTLNLNQDMQKALQEWCERIYNRLDNLSYDPSSENSEELQEKLNTLLDQFENNLMNSLSKLDGSKMRPQVGESFYRLLGAYRNLSESLVTYASICDKVNWTYWHEARFA